MIPSDCFFLERAKASTEGELAELFREIKTFYSDPDRRTCAVYLRDDAVILDQIRRGLFFIVRNEQGTLIAGSALYPLANGQPIDCAVSSSGDVIGRGCAVELTSVLRMKNGKTDIDLPPGIWGSLLFSVPMITAFQKAGSPELPIDFLVANVQSDRANVINCLTGANPAESPFRWKLIKPAGQLKESFQSTTHDKNKDRRKNFYIAPVENVADVAAFLLDCSTRGFITNYKGQRVFLDFSGLGMQEILETIVEREGLFNEEISPNASWTEARRHVDSAAFGNVRKMGRLA
jgi:hypothetical protein